MNEIRPIKSLDPALRTLVRKAMKVRKRAYAPYSHFRVGCAIEDSDGKVHTGCNVENASYPAVSCAERVAVGKMVSRGNRNIRRVVVVTSSDEAIFPCGVCLQIMLEFGTHASVIAVNRMGTVFREAELSELIPGGFTVVQLKGSKIIDISKGPR